MQWGCSQSFIRILFSYSSTQSLCAFAVLLQHDANLGSYFGSFDLLPSNQFSFRLIVQRVASDRTTERAAQEAWKRENPLQFGTPSVVFLTHFCLSFLSSELPARPLAKKIWFDTTIFVKIFFRRTNWWCTVYWCPVRSQAVCSDQRNWFSHLECRTCHWEEVRLCAAHLKPIAAELEKTTLRAWRPIQSVAGTARTIDVL